jgi:hypothetical protein
MCLLDLFGYHRHGGSNSLVEERALCIVLLPYSL